MPRESARGGGPFSRTMAYKGAKLWVRAQCRHVVPMCVGEEAHHACVDGHPAPAQWPTTAPCPPAAASPRSCPWRRPSTDTHAHVSRSPRPLLDRQVSSATPWQSVGSATQQVSQTTWSASQVSDQRPQRGPCPARAVGQSVSQSVSHCQSVSRSRSSRSCAKPGSQPISSTAGRAGAAPARTTQIGARRHCVAAAARHTAAAEKVGKNGAGGRPQAPLTACYGARGVSATATPAGTWVSGPPVWLPGGSVADERVAAAYGAQIWP